MEWERSSLGGGLFLIYLGEKRGVSNFNLTSVCNKILLFIKKLAFDGFYPLLVVL